MEPQPSPAAYAGQMAKVELRAQWLSSCNLWSLGGMSEAGFTLSRSGELQAGGKGEWEGWVELRAGAEGREEGVMDVLL